MHIYITHNIYIYMYIYSQTSPQQHLWFHCVVGERDFASYDLVRRFDCIGVGTMGAGGAITTHTHTHTILLMIILVN